MSHDDAIMILLLAGRLSNLILIVGCTLVFSAVWWWRFKESDTYARWVSPLARAKRKARKLGYTHVDCKSELVPLTDRDWNSGFADERWNLSTEHHIFYRKDGACFAWLLLKISAQSML